MHAFIFLIHSLYLSSIITRSVQASITVYNQTPFGQQSRTSDNSIIPTPISAAYDETQLEPPPIPTPFNRTFALNLVGDAKDVTGLSIPHWSGVSFFGFSIEMSVVNQVLGKNS